MRTSELAEQAGVNPQTLRYYERRRLLPQPDRSSAGYRAYPANAVRIVQFIKRAQQFGFTLDDIGQLLHLADGGPDNCDTVRAMTEDKITDLDRRITELQTMRDALARLSDTCGRPRRQRECPILHQLDRDTPPTPREACDRRSHAEPPSPAGY